MEYHQSRNLDLRLLGRLKLIKCLHPCAIDWDSCPRDLEEFEIVDPVQVFPIRANHHTNHGIILKALSHFPRLKVLNIQNVGGPICEILLDLGQIGRSITDLTLHDQDIEGIDMIYRYDRPHPLEHLDPLDCHFFRLLAHVCPNVQQLSVDITSQGLRDDLSEIHWRGLEQWESMLGELAHTNVQAWREHILAQSSATLATENSLRKRHMQ